MSAFFSYRYNKFLIVGAVLTVLYIVVFLAPSQPKEDSFTNLSTESHQVNTAGAVLDSDDTTEPLYPESKPVVAPAKPLEQTADSSFAEDKPEKASKPDTGAASAVAKPKAAPSKAAAPLHDSKEEAKAAKGSSKSSSCTADEEYVIMIDAGSTGSRIHVYSFDTCVSPPKLLKEEFKMLNPGLSSFDTDAVGAAASLDELLDLAVATVPKAKQGCTPVALKATAGLRLLGEEKSRAILAEVRSHLENDYPFPVVEGDGISIMDGSDEGVYAWITTNYLLGNIGAKEKRPTAAVFDLGGGSTQIVFEPLDGQSMIEGEHKYEVSFGGSDFTLYQYSHLGFGLMQGRRKVNSLVVEAALKDSKYNLTPASGSDATADVSIPHPCLPPGTTAEDVKVELADKTTYVVNFVSMAKNENDDMAKTASVQCRSLAETILNKELECESKSCSFNGIYQPSLRHQFSQSSDMFIFSYFYDRLKPIGMPLSFTLDEMKDLTKLVCSGSSAWNQYLTQPESIKELTDEPLWCLDLSFMTALLHTGYDIPLDRELRTAKKISDNELGWCLGASLPLLDKNSGWTCKVTKD
ncbi:hypothetical protein OGAPHI_000360 [Ogataea philodendri]|uniref:guanosine-diphosphatase n=2 Tax=Ogataea TaxID=461281 RepID=A0A9P8PHC3_9ASCO|nr:uncharacterized protein OGAPHI_000360 [Ogataea philodendri]KAH3671655.1 hypothetical protein OGAPHI_000360 [Ogataea philodendri]